MPTPPPETEFAERGREIEFEIGNTLQRVLDNYTKHWEGIIREILQNSYDGWCCNRLKRGTLPETQDLRIQIKVNTDDGVLRVHDNAGGMPETVFESAFTGLDTPGEEKQDGDYVGGYGRGIHVVAGLSNNHVMYAETNHDGDRNAAFVKVSTHLPVTPDFNFIHDGTVLEVHDADETVLNRLADWPAVEKYIQANFNPLLTHDDVTVEYTIDGETHVVEPFPVEEFDVLYEDDIEFTYGGETHVYRDVVIYDQTSADIDVPLNGVAMLKGNKHMDYPFMTIKDYMPATVRHRGKLFGFCDASDLCPEYEDSSHNDFRSDIPSNTPLKTVIKEIEMENFVGATVDLDHKDEIEETTIRVVNEVFDQNEVFGSEDPFNDGAETNGEKPVVNDGGVVSETPGDDTPTDSPENPDTPGETSVDDPEQVAEDNIDLWDPDEFPRETSEGEEPGEETTDPTDITGESEAEIEEDETQEGLDDWEFTQTDRGTDPVLTCTARKRHFTTGKTAKFWSNIDNPDESDTTRFTIEAEVEHKATGEITPLGERTVRVPTGEGTSDEEPWTHTLEDEGQYTFTAYLTGTDTDDQQDAIDSDATWVKAKDESRDGDSEEDEADPAPFLQAVEFIGDETDPEFRYDLVQSNAGMKLIVNMRHPEYKYTEDQQTGSEIEKISLLTIRWALEGLSMFVLDQRVESTFGNLYTDDGEPVTDMMREFIRDDVESLVSSHVHDAYRELTTTTATNSP